MPRTVAVAVLALTVLTAVSLGGPVAAGEPASTTAPPAGAGAPDILPRPVDEPKAQRAGDSGSGAQLAVAGGIVVALGALGALAVRDVRRSRRQPT